MANHEDLLERGEITVLQKHAPRIPDAKYKPLLHKNYFNKEVDGSEMIMKHNRISYFFERNTCIKVKPTIKIQITTNFKTVIDFAHILAFPLHLHEKSNETFYLRKNWFLRIQVLQLQLTDQKGYFGYIDKRLCNKETIPPKCATCQFLKHKRNYKHRKKMKAAIQPGELASSNQYDTSLDRYFYSKRVNNYHSFKYKVKTYHTMSPLYMILL